MHNYSRRASEAAWAAEPAGADPYTTPVECPKAFSQFGGLWTDMSNAPAILKGKLETGQLSEKEYEDVKFWIEKGYVILPNAVRNDLIDQLIYDIEKVWHEGHPEAWVSAVEDGRGVTRPLAADDYIKVDNLVKLVDIYEYLETARRVIFSKSITRFLEIVFDRQPMAHQSLSFYRGSKQPIHQDTAFVRISSPMELAASWIALEDVHPGTGELHYYEGSHRFPEYLFADQWKWLPPSGGDISQFYKHLESQAGSRGLSPIKFYPKKGDALIWSADLAHGGSDYTDNSRTRKSLVTHYCPVNCHPMYFHYGEHSGKNPWGNSAWWCAAKKVLWRAGG